MKSEIIERWISSLGKTYPELLVNGTLPKTELIELFPDIDEVYCEPAAGIELQFWAKTERFENLHITFLHTTPSTTRYVGELPPPYSLQMNQSLVHELFGIPFEATGPIKMPYPVGQTGGWESYKLDETVYPNTKVVFKYLESMEVEGITFTLVDKDHPYP